jgi:hypothetical protein
MSKKDSRAQTSFLPRDQNQWVAARTPTREGHKKAMLLRLLLLYFQTQFRPFAGPLHSVLLSFHISLTQISPRAEAARLGDLSYYPGPEVLRQLIFYLLAMALRTFRSNPSLGGFGGESSAPHVQNFLNGPTSASRSNKNGKKRNNQVDSSGTCHSVQDCDAFAQIIKELVDNAVDACCMSTGLLSVNHDTPRNRHKRVRVVLEPFEPPSSATKDEEEEGLLGEPTGSKAIASQRSGKHNSTSNDIVNANAEASKNDDDDDEDEHDSTATNEILRVTVSDNGCGMEDIQDCVEAFRSSKAGNKNNKSDLAGYDATSSASNKNSAAAASQKLSATSNSNSGAAARQQGGGREEELLTAGRYGIGLTLCLLHAQRLVPNSCASITSATAAAPHFCKRHYVVDTEGDSVRCIDQTWIPKSYRDESGTSISVLIPVCDIIEILFCRSPLSIMFLKKSHSLGIPVCRVDQQLDWRGPVWLNTLHGFVLVWGSLVVWRSWHPPSPKYRCWSDHPWKKGIDNGFSSN